MTVEARRGLWNNAQRQHSSIITFLSQKLQMYVIAFANLYFEDFWAQAYVTGGCVTVGSETIHKRQHSVIITFLSRDVSRNICLTIVFLWA